MKAAPLYFGIAFGLAVASLSAQTGKAAPDEDATREWILAETARVRAEAEKAGGDAAQGTTAVLAEVERDANAGRPLVALRRLGVARGNLPVDAAYRGAAAAQEKGELDAAAVAAVIDAVEAEVSAAGESPASAHAALRAMADGSRNRARGLVAGGRGFAGTGDLPGGVAYATSAREELAFARDLLALPLVPHGPPPRPRDLAAELERIDLLASEAYRKPGVEIARHADFIGLNALIKEARELLARGRDLAALSTLLDVRRRLVAIDDDAPVPENSELRALAASWRTRIAGLDHDAGIARLFVERAESELDLAQTDREAARRVAATLLTVLPRYLELVSEDAP